MMTKYKSQQPDQGNILDRIYHSFSVDFWLVTANLVLVTNWFLNPESLLATLFMAGGVSLGGWVIINNNRRNQQRFNDLIRRYKITGLLTLVLSLVVAITVFNYATSPSHALILTSQGITQLQQIFTIGGGGANANVTKMINGMILIFRALFFLGFMWALYKAYEKYTQQSELMDVIQTPLVLLIVVGIIDGAAAIFLQTVS
jgi:hypothetical protein